MPKAYECDVLVIGTDFQMRMDDSTMGVNVGD